MRDVECGSTKLIERYVLNAYEHMLSRLGRMPIAPRNQRIRPFFPENSAVHRLQKNKHPGRLDLHYAGQKRTEKTGSFGDKKLAKILALLGQPLPVWPADTQGIKMLK